MNRTIHRSINEINRWLHLIDASGQALRRLASEVAVFLTRDPQVKERKKYGQKGARAEFRFSKR